MTDEIVPSWGGAQAAIDEALAQRVPPPLSDC
jgi:hypothetical protein